MRADALVRECTVCHGVNEAQRGPILDGMEYWYLLDQLEKFHSGVRGQNAANKSEYLMGVGIRKVKNSVEMAYLADWFPSRSLSRVCIRWREMLAGAKNFMRKMCILSWSRGTGESYCSGSFPNAVGRVVFS